MTKVGGTSERSSRTRYVAVRDADHGRSVLKFLFEYGPLAPAIGDDALPWRLVLRRDVIEVHAANAIADGGAAAFDALLIECGGAIAIARLVLARLGFESSVSWGLREGTHVASVHAGAWRTTMVAELPPMFSEAAPAEDDEGPEGTRPDLIEGWKRLAGACGASMEIVARPSAATTRAPLERTEQERPLESAMRFALEGIRAPAIANRATFPPFEDGFVARLHTTRRGPAALVALGHAAASVALDARASGYAFASGPLERTSGSMTMAIALGRARRAGEGARHVPPTFAA